MTVRILSSVITAALLAGAPLASQAAAFTKIDPAQSKITFQYSQMGVKLDGDFSKFNGEISFDPEQADQGKARLEVALASVDAGADEANDELGNAEWFDTKAFPGASFETHQIRALGDNRFEVDGTLNIKGNTRELTTPVTFTPAGDNQGVFAGTFTIQRNDFGIGTGSWSKTDIVADDVAIHFQLHVAR